MPSIQEYNSQRDANLPRVLDDACEKFEKFAADEREWRGWETRYIDELIERARAVVQTPNKTLPGAQATLYLESLIATVQSAVVADLQAYGPVRWLWYLRRLPSRIFAGRYGTTLGYGSVLAESLTWYSTGEDDIPPGNRLIFRADHSAFRHTCRLVAGAKILAHLHAVYRRVGKGEILNLGTAIPICIHDPRIDACIRIYDERVDRRGADFAGQGLSSRASDLSEVADDADLVSSMRLVRRCLPFWAPTSVVSPDGRSFDANVQMMFTLSGAGAGQFLDPYEGEPAKLTYLQEIEPLVLLLIMLPLMFSHFSSAVSTVLRFGYVFGHEEIISSSIDKWISAITPKLSADYHDIKWSMNYREWRARIDSLSPSTWPLEQGGVVRQMRAAVLLDVSAASAALLARTEIDRRDSATGKIRGRAFELQVQETIDKSRWAPNPSLAAIRGRTLQRAGKAITDIDALGSDGDTLLIVSCKSSIYDREYDKGAHRVISNAQEMVDSAVSYWAQIVIGLRTNPVGSNFDFTRYSRILGVVCTPFAIYSSTPATLEFVSGQLRACTSESELSAWLST